MGDRTTFDFFRQETSHSDAIVRTEAMSKLNVIASLMSPTTVKTELIPYLQTKLTDLDQIILHLCKHIASLFVYVGGPSQAGCLLPLIEPICHIEETIIREAITQSICSILSSLKPEHEEVIKGFFEMTQKLYEGDEESESFFSRVTICFYIHELYKAAPDPGNKDSIREMFSKLVTDDFPMVRSSAAKILPKLAKYGGKDLLLGEFQHYLIALCTDESECVKVSAVESLKPYGELMISMNTSMEQRNELINTVRSAATDSFWRVRLAMCKIIGFFVPFFSPDRITADILSCGISLIQDVEIEVRSIAIISMADFYSISGTTFLTEFVPVAKMLLEDPQQNMRKGVCDVCIDVAAQAGQEIAANYFNDIILKLIADPDPMVRLRVLKKLPKIAKDIPSLCVRLVTSLRAFYSDSNWRIRQQLCYGMPAIIRYLGIEFFTDHFLAEFLLTFKDDVSEVRLAACDCLTDFIDASGVDFVRVHIFPILKSLFNMDYLRRVTMLRALSALLQGSPSEPFQTECLSLVLSSSTDPVPNIRILVGKCFTEIESKILEPNPRSLIRSSLQILKTDKDKDVAHFATLAVDSYHV